MAEDSDSSDKTEDPTQKRLDDAHERGDVAKSQEVNTWFMIAGGTLVLSSFGASAGQGILAPLRNLVANAAVMPTDGASLIALTGQIGLALLAALGVPFLLLMLAAAAGNMVQHRPVWSAEALKPKLSKLSPLAGAKRLFGKQAAANFAKGLFKIVLLGAVMLAILWPQRNRLEPMVRQDPATLLGETTGLTLQLLAAAVALLAIVAIADFLFCSGSVSRAEDVVEEDEECSSCRRAIRISRRHPPVAMRGCAADEAAVPRAAVVISNPTPMRWL